MVQILRVYQSARGTTKELTLVDFSIEDENKFKSLIHMKYKDNKTPDKIYSVDVQTFKDSCVYDIHSLVS